MQSRQPIPNDDPAQFLSLKELCQLLRISDRTARTYVRDPINPLPAFKLNNGKLLFSREAVLVWLDGHKVRPIDVDRLVNDLIEHEDKDDQAY